jgi:hypothetical protein
MYNASNKWDREEERPEQILEFCTRSKKKGKLQLLNPNLCSMFPSSSSRSLIIKKTTLYLHTYQGLELSSTSHSLIQDGIHKTVKENY